MSGRWQRVYAKGVYSILYTDRPYIIVLESTDYRLLVEMKLPSYL